MGIAYNPKIVTDGLVLCLDAANPKSYPGSGTTWADLSGNGNNAVQKGTTGYASWNSLGYFEHRPINYFGAADISSTATDAGGSWWEVAHSSTVSPNGSWTVGGWLKVIGDQSSNGTGWFHKTGNADERGIHLEPIDGNFRANASDGWQQISYNINNSSVWANFYFVFTQTSGTYGTNAGSIQLYINSVLVATDSSFTPKIDSTSVIYLGRRNGHLRHFLNADIASYNYYNKALTESDVQQNFNATRGRFNI